MGLSSSQARLLSLTARQHSLEYDAQRLMANKLRLANESDKIYQNYTNALDETTIKTLQTDSETGHSSWIDGSLNNLLRYGTSADTTGTTFYVQKMDDGKLYLPKSIGDTYDAVVADTNNPKDFAKAFGVNYKTVDHNLEMLTNYTDAKNKGWDTLLGSTEAECQRVYREYIDANEYDANVRSYGLGLKNMLEKLYNYGLYQIGAYDETSQPYLVTRIGGTTGSRGLLSEEHLHDIYSNTEVQLMSAAILLIGKIKPNYREDTTEVDGHKTTQKTYRLAELKATSPSGTEYINRSSNKYSLTFTNNELFSMVLNGGTYNAAYKETTRITYDSVLYGINSENTTDVSDSINVYNIAVHNENGVDETVADLLSAYSSAEGRTFDSLGNALQYMFTKSASSSHYIDEFYSINGLTNEDIKHYEEWVEIKTAREMYTPDIELVPDDPALAAHYEQMFSAIQAAGGWEVISDDKAKSASWVTNMIKSAQVILTTWDTENEMLSKTAGTLNTNLREMTNQQKINQAEQIFEAEMDKVNEKDARIDKKLQKTESERSAIVSEMESLKSIIKLNIDTNFKLFT